MTVAFLGWLGCRAQRQVIPGPLRQPDRGQGLRGLRQRVCDL